jgi:hypothetical protein
VKITRWIVVAILVLVLGVLVVLLSASPVPPERPLDAIYMKHRDTSYLLTQRRKRRRGKIMQEVSLCFRKCPFQSLTFSLVNSYLNCSCLVLGLVPDPEVGLWDEPDYYRA